MSFDLSEAADEALYSYARASDRVLLAQEFENIGVTIALVEDNEHVGIRCYRVVILEVEQQPWRGYGYETYQDAKAEYDLRANKLLVEEINFLHPQVEPAPPPKPDGWGRFG